MILVHSDAYRTRHLVKPGPRDQVLDAHLDRITEFADGDDVWMPAFNYDWCRTGRMGEGSQVGPISERFRTTRADWQTLVPVFAVSGVGAMPRVKTTDEIDPFDVWSAFDALVCRDGVILWYGAPISSTTFIHHVERMMGVPYRYDKLFPGEVDGHAVTLRYHVRPAERRLEYDWPRLESVLERERLAENVWVACAHDVFDRWTDLLDEDPLALLDAESRAWVEPMLDELGRPFMLSDFE